MSEKKIKARIQQKHDTSTNWALATNFKPKAGELIIYDDLKKMKVGDGETLVNNLPFLSADVSQDLNNYATLAGNNTFTGKNTFTSGGIVVSTTDWTNKTTKADYGSHAIAYTPYGETRAKIISLPHEEGTLALTSDVNKILTGSNIYTGYNSFSHRVAVTDGSSSSNNLACLDYNCITRSVGTSNYTLTIPEKSGTIALTSDIPTVTHKYLHHLYITGYDETAKYFAICAMYVSNSNTEITNATQLLSAVQGRIMATGYCGGSNTTKPVYFFQKSQDDDRAITIHSVTDSGDAAVDVNLFTISGGSITDTVTVL